MRMNRGKSGRKKENEKGDSQFESGTGGGEINASLEMDIHGLLFGVTFDT